MPDLQYSLDSCFLEFQAERSCLLERNGPLANRQRCVEVHTRVL